MAVPSRDPQTREGAPRRGKGEGSPSLRVARLGASDLPQLLGARALFDRPPSETAAARYLADDRNVFFLGSQGATAVGFLRGTALAQVDSARLQMFIYEVDVAPVHRRRGVGAALIRAVLEYCRSLDFEEAFVFTDPGNTAAVALYRSTGGVTETDADRMFVYRL